MKRLITETLRNQFDSTLHMARILVKVCPDSVWALSFNGVPFWQQVFHYVYYLDFWMRESYDESPWRSMIFDDAYTTDLYAESYKGLFISRKEMLCYLERIGQKTARIFDSLEDDQLSVPVEGDDPHYSYADVIVGQIRHVMYNIGYLNGILRQQGMPESDWYSYNEPEGS
ncbi:MAG: DinB family protein [Clostridiales bacterium]|nr:DinB family protein [Clostridiales bacterium]